MNWYYMDGDKEAGPIDAATLKSLYTQKKISGNTRVRREDKETWQPFESLIKGHQSKKACSQCGQQFSDDNLVRFGETLICETCKPIFTQQLKEGVHLSENYRYAGFWIRFLAKLIDSIILGVVNILVVSPLSPNLESTTGIEAPPNIPLITLVLLINFSIPLFYSTFLVGKYGATLGKMACGIRIIVPGEDKVSYLRAFGRIFAEWLSGMILCIGYLMAAFDSEKRSLHDRICNTRVVKK